MEDERRILKSLRDIKDLLDHFNPSLTTKFNIKSLLTLVVENTFSEMRSGAFDMPLQLEFDYRFSRAIKERLKRQCFTPFAYFTAPKSYYPQVFTTTYYNDLPKLCPPKAHKLSEKQVSEMRNRRAMFGQIVLQKTVQNMTTKDNPGTLRCSCLTCYNYREDTLELEEDDLILLLDVLHHTNEVVTVAEVAESVEMTETAVDEVRHERIPRRRKRRFESDFFLL